MNAKQIIRQVCAERGFFPDEVLGRGRRSLDVSETRSEIIRRLKAVLSVNQIALMLGMNHSSVTYHLYPMRKVKSNQRSAVSYAKARASI